MLFAVQLSDDQIAVLGSAVAFGACLVMMLISQKIGNSLRGQSQKPAADVVPFPKSRQISERDSRAA